MKSKFNQHAIGVIFDSKLQWGDHVASAIKNGLIHKFITQSKSKTIITRSIYVISLIVFTDQYQRTHYAFYTKMVFNCFIGRLGKGS